MGSLNGLPEKGRLRYGTYLQGRMVSFDGVQSRQMAINRTRQESTAGTGALSCSRTRRRGYHTVVIIGQRRKDCHFRGVIRGDGPASAWDLALLSYTRFDMSTSLSFGCRHPSCVHVPQSWSTGALH